MLTLNCAMLFTYAGNFFGKTYCLAIIPVKRKLQWKKFKQKKTKTMTKN